MPSQACQTSKIQRSLHLGRRRRWWEAPWHRWPCLGRQRVWCPSHRSAATAAPSSTWEIRNLSRNLVRVNEGTNCFTNWQETSLVQPWLMAPTDSTEIIEDVAESPAPPALPVSVVSPPSQEKEAYKRLGLTKQVLAAHTQKEELAFLTRCRELNARTFQKDCSTRLHKHRGPAIAQGTQSLPLNHRRYTRSS